MIAKKVKAFYQHSKSHPRLLFYFVFLIKRITGGKTPIGLLCEYKKKRKSKSVPIPCENDFEISHQNHWLFSFEISKGKRFLLVYSRTSPWYERRSEEKTSTWPREHSRCFSGTLFLSLTSLVSALIFFLLNNHFFCQSRYFTTAWKQIHSTTLHWFGKPVICKIFPSPLT